MNSDSSSFLFRGAGQNLTAILCDPDGSGSADGWRAPLETYFAEMESARPFLKRTCIPSYTLEDFQEFLQPLYREFESFQIRMHAYREPVQTPVRLTRDVGRTLEPLLEVDSSRGFTGKRARRKRRLLPPEVHPVETADPRSILLQALSSPTSRSDPRTFSRYSNLFSSSTLQILQESDDGFENPILRKLPAVFLLHDFDLSNPDIFEAVQRISRTPLLLQEKLSYYIDQVEIGVITEVSRRAQSFFHLVSQFSILDRSLTELRREVSLYRNSMHNLDTIVSRDRLVEVQYRRRKENQLVALKMMQSILFVMGAVDRVEGNVSRCDFENAYLEYRRAMHIVQSMRLRSIQGLQTYLPRLFACRDHITREMEFALQSEIVRWIELPSSDSILESILGCHPLDPSLIPPCFEASERWERLNDTSRRILCYEDSIHLLLLIVYGVDQPSESLQERTSRLRSLLGTLCRYGDVLTAFEGVRSPILRALKATVRDVIESCLRVYSHISSPEHPSSMGTNRSEGNLSELESSFSPGDSSSSRASELPDRIRRLSHSQFMFVLSSVLDRLMRILEHTDIVFALVLRAVQSVSNSAFSSSSDLYHSLDSSGSSSVSFVSSSLFPKLQTVLLNLLASICESCFSRTEQVLRVRDMEEFGRSDDPSQIGSRRPPLWTDVSEALAIAFGFSDSARERVQFSLTGTVGLSLERQIAPSVMVGLSLASFASLRGREYVVSCMSRLTKKLVEVLDGESWSPISSPDAVQTMVDELVSRCWNHDSSVVEDSPVQLDSPGSFGKENGYLSPPGRPSLLYIQNLDNGSIEGFSAVSSLIELVKATRDLIQIALSIPQLAHEPIRGVSHLISVFNARSCELVLGAGAMKKAGLKRITPKHLAMTAETLDFILLFVRNLRVSLRSRLVESRVKQVDLVLSELSNTLVADIEEHRRLALEKCRSIMSDITETHTSLIVGLLVETEEEFSAASSNFEEMASTLLSDVDKFRKSIRRCFRLPAYMEMMESIVHAIDERVAVALDSICCSIPRAVSGFVDRAREFSKSLQFVEPNMEISTPRLDGYIVRTEDDLSRSSLSLLEENTPNKSDVGDSSHS